MGKLNNGLFGGFHGRVGNLVGYMLNGKSIIRTIGKSSKPLTPGRKANCEKMKVINTFLKSNTDFIRSGFKLVTAGTDKNFYNEAVSYNKKHALQGEYPNISIDYTKAVVSMGNLLIAGKTEISRIEEGIEFKWEVPTDLPRQNRNDRAMLLIYFPDENTSTCILSGARREEGRDVVYINTTLSKCRMEAYISFINDNGTEISDSVYVGILNHIQIKKEQLKPITIIQEKQNPVPSVTQEPGQNNKSFQWSSSHGSFSTPIYSYTFYQPPT